MARRLVLVIVLFPHQRFKNLVQGEDVRPELVSLTSSFLVSIANNKLNGELGYRLGAAHMSFFPAAFIRRL